MGHASLSVSLSLCLSLSLSLCLSLSLSFSLSLLHHFNSSRVRLDRAKWKDGRGTRTIFHSRPLCLNSTAFDRRVDKKCVFAQNPFKSDGEFTKLKQRLISASSLVTIQAKQRLVNTKFPRNMLMLVPG
jgi:hypothetical protein